MQGVIEESTKFRDRAFDVWSRSKHEFPQCCFVCGLLQLQPVPVKVRLRLVLMISGLLLGQMFQEVLVKMSASRGTG